MEADSQIGRRQRVLVIGVDPMTCSIYAGWFRKKNFIVGKAHSDEEALLRIKTVDWDLTLLDINLLRADGSSLQSHIHQIRQELIVILTGLAPVRAVLTAIENGAYDYIGDSPLDEVAHRLYNALDHQRSRKEAERLTLMLRESEENKAVLADGSVDNKGRTLEDLERTHILQVLQTFRGNRTRAAEVLDIDRATLYKKLKKYGIASSRDHRTFGT